MDTDTPTSQPTPQARYVDMLVDNDHDDKLKALETIRGASQYPEDTLVNQDEPAAMPERRLITRVPTPERIRRTTVLLYDDIHAMMDRHQARTGRERELRNRGSRNARISYLNAGSTSAQRGCINTSRSPQEETPTKTTTMLPNVHHLFEESRKDHLAKAQQQRTYFPSSSKPISYSPKNPSTFSYRFYSSPLADGGI
ncbi:hypothetical protein JKF63_06198 [Porcisia hertigi]|uniref:Uncharacterized protein n=1 Tax=Porcisia hertigi TaxID=2761500 RepID=A0A836IU70_9TRYP|nr:hypothetical protein JKF63_06198 [Porcisia hertigi]